MNCNVFELSAGEGVAGAARDGSIGVSVHVVGKLGFCWCGPSLVWYLLLGCLRRLSQPTLPVLVHRPRGGGHTRATECLGVRERESERGSVV